MTDILYGSPQQIQIVERANSIWALLRDDPRFAFQARTVSLAEEQVNTTEIVINLARLQGYASCHFVPSGNAPVYEAAYQEAGLRSATWHQFWGRDSALTQSAAFLKSFDPPEGLTLRAVEPDTPDDTIHRICDMSQAAGVLPPPGAAMRGRGPRGVYLYVQTTDGEIVASGGAFMAYHPESARADEAFWGMLATREDQRGRRLASWVGAQAILRMGEAYGARGFSSGVKADNPSSQAMCARLGVGPSDYRYVGAEDPATLGAAPVTR